MDFNIKSNIQEFERLVGRQKKQVPFATSKAINDTFKGMRPYLIRHIKRRQKSKKAWWNNKRTGINRTFANKRMVPMRGSIYTAIWWAGLQEHGGIKTPYRGDHIAVPTKKAPAYARKSGGVKKVLKGKKVWANEKGVYRRKGSKKSPVVEKLHTFTGKAVIKPMLGFKTTCHKFARRNFPKIHSKNMIKALKTARRY